MEATGDKQLQGSYITQELLKELNKVGNRLLIGIPCERKEGEKRLALNFLSDALHLRNAAVELLHRFPGNTEVLFRDAATGKVLLAPRHCCVNCAEELLFELKRMLGEENVKIVRKK